MEKELQAKATLFFITFFSQLRSNALDSWNRGISLRATLPKISWTFDSNFSLGKNEFYSDARKRIIYGEKNISIIFIVKRMLLFNQCKPTHSHLMTERIFMERSQLIFTRYISWLSIQINFRSNLSHFSNSLFLHRCTEFVLVRPSWHCRWWPGLTSPTLPLGQRPGMIHAWSPRGGRRPRWPFHSSWIVLFLSDFLFIPLFIF